MIRVNGITNPIKVISPNLEGENDNPQLQIMCCRIRLMRLQLPRSVSDHATPLHQYYTQNHDLRITINHEFLKTLREGQNRRITQPLPHGLKSGMLLRPPIKSDGLLCQPSQRNHYLGEILNESPILTCQPKETLNLIWRPGNLPSHHDIDLGRIDRN